jgi:hypothetical protein
MAGQIGMAAVTTLSTIGSRLSTLADAHRCAATIASLPYRKRLYLVAPDI